MQAESEIRIIKLHKKAQGENSNNGKQRGENTSNADASVQKYLATDYFDSLSVIKKDLSTPIASYMEYMAEDGNAEITSTQSCALYCSKEMLEKYEADNSAHRGNPFEKKDEEWRYLSIVQIHITSECLRRITYGNKELWNTDSIILEPFLDDLYEIIQEYGEKKDKKEIKDNFVCRIYQLLSAGDLAVVIRSRDSETPFEIVKRIRVRRIEKVDPEQGTLYKTHALLAIEANVALYHDDNSDNDINERYMLIDMEMEGNDDPCISKCVELDSRRNSKSFKTLKEVNDQYINNLIKKFEIVASETIRIRDAHKNLEQYFKLMKRQLLFCRVINQVDEARIYVREIGRQLEIALDGIEKYRQIIIEEDNFAMLDIMVKNIKNTVHMIDRYIAYIRNNNFQSLQMLSDNIESGMSMGKMLVGYNEWLRCFIETYHEIERQMQAKESKKLEGTKEYFPVIIPDLYYMDISVQVPFAEGLSQSWEKEEKIRKGKQSFLMIVESPTPAELGDMPIFMALLFHEMAHQFRYESRGSRNRCILDMLSAAYASQIVTNIATEVCRRLGCEEVEMALFGILNKAFKRAIFSKMKLYLDGEKIKWEAPLLFFSEEVLGALQDFSYSWKHQMKTENVMKYFIKAMQKYENLCKEPQYQYIAEVEKTLRDMRSSTVLQAEKWEEHQKKLLKYAFIISGLAVNSILGVNAIPEMKWLQDKQKVKEWIDENEKQMQISSFWKSLREADVFGEEKRKIEWIEAAFYSVGRGLPSPTEPEHKHYFSGQEEMLVEVYKEVCDKWKEKENDYAKIVAGEENENARETVETYRAWALVGRYLGIDNRVEENEKKFAAIMRNGLFIEFPRQVLLQKKGIYREVTADLFMYTIMEMTPFTYLM